MVAFEVVKLQTPPTRRLFAPCTVTSMITNILVPDSWYTYMIQNHIPRIGIGDYLRACFFPLLGPWVLHRSVLGELEPQSQRAKYEDPGSKNRVLNGTNILKCNKYTYMYGCIHTYIIYIYTCIYINMYAHTHTGNRPGGWAIPSCCSKASVGLV